MTPCGHCDNCTRPDDLVEHREVTREAWKILKRLEQETEKSEAMTLDKLCNLVVRRRDDVDNEVPASRCIGLSKNVWVVRVHLKKCQLNIVLACNDDCHRTLV